MRRSQRPPRTCGDAGGRTKRGTSCEVTLNLSPDSGLCVMHDPARAETRDALRRAGGRATKESGRRRRAHRAKVAGMPPPPTTIAEAEAFASWLVGAVCEGAIDPKTAREATGALREFRSASEKRVLVDQIKALRAELAQAKAGNR